MLVLITQGVLMLFVTMAPFLEKESLDFSLWPLSFAKSLGFLLNVFGFALVISAVRTMRKNFEIRVQQRSSSNLVMNGPFAFVRNPTYLGGLMMSFGWSVSFSSLLGLTASILLTITLLIKIKMEESALLAQFGKEYEHYLKQVPRLFPMRF